MKRILILLLLLILILRPALAVPTNGVPLQRSYLQTALDGNLKAITNAGKIESTNFSGYIGTLSNGPSGVIWFPQMQYGSISNGARIESTNFNGIVGAVTNGAFWSNNAAYFNSTNQTSYGTHKFAGPADFTGNLGFGGYASYISAVGDYFIISPESAYRIIIGALGARNGIFANSLLASNDVTATSLVSTQLSMFGPSTLRNTNWFPAGSSIAFQKYPLTTLANGANATVPIGTNVFVELSGNTAAVSLHGLWAGVNRDGDLRFIVYRQSYPFTIAHESGTEPFSTNRIRIATAGDRVFAGPVAMTFLYSGSEGRWLLIAADGNETLAANITGGAGTATNAPDGSAIISTNMLALDRGYYSPQHRNLGRYPVLDNLMRSNLPVRMLVVRDGAFRPEVGITEAWKAMGLRANGSGSFFAVTALGNYMYQSSAGTVSVITPVGTSSGSVDPLSPWGGIHMGNGSSFTNVSTVSGVQGWPTTRIAVKCYQYSSLGSLQIYTNAYGAAPGLFQTLNNASGATMTGVLQTYDLPGRITNCVVSVVSVNSNIVVGVGQWDTNFNAGIRLDEWGDNNHSILDFTYSATLSNSCRAWLADYDALVISDLANPGDVSRGATNLWALIKSANLNMDVVICSSVWPTAASSVNSDLELDYQQAASLTPFVYFDSAGVMRSTNSYQQAMFYTGGADGLGATDGVHGNPKGQQWLGSVMMRTLDWTAQRWGLYLNPDAMRTNYAFVPAVGFQNAATYYTALDHIYTYLGFPYRSWGLRVASGSTFQNYTFAYPGNQLGQRRDLYARLQCLTTNLTTYSDYLQALTFPIDGTITNSSSTFGWSTLASSGSITMGSSSKTNITYTPWRAIKPTAYGPWGGWIMVGTGATSVGANFFILGAELRTDPPDFWATP